MSLIPEPKQPEAVPMPPMPAKPEEPGKLSYNNGILMLTTKFDNENIMPLVAKIQEYNLMDKGPEIIHMYINSGGGEVSACLHLIDVMKQSRIPVHTYGMGLVASCAFMTLMAGEKRYATQNTMLMSHEYSGGNSGKKHELEASIKRMDIISHQLLNHYMKCTRKTAKYVTKHLLPPSDVWLTAEECVAHGVIDSVITTY